MFTLAYWLGPKYQELDTLSCQVTPPKEEEVIVDAISPSSFWLQPFICRGNKQSRRPFKNMLSQRVVHVDTYLSLGWQDTWCSSWDILLAMVLIDQSADPSVGLPCPQMSDRKPHVTVPVTSAYISLPTVIHTSSQVSFCLRAYPVIRSSL